MPFHVYCDSDSSSDILSTMRTDVGSLPSIDPVSERIIYNIEKRNVKEIFKTYKTKVPNTLCLDKDMLPLFNNVKFEKVLRKQNYEQDIALYLNKKIKVFRKVKQRIEAHSALLRDFKVKCNKWVMDQHLLDNTIDKIHLSNVWKNLEVLLKRLIKIYEALSERWTILESIFREISDDLDNFVKEKYKHKLLKTLVLKDSVGIVDMLDIYVMEWEYLFSSRVQ